MPNGEDKNWVRACLALEAFHARYGHWPTRLRFPSYAFEDLQHLFKRSTLRRFLSRFEIVVDDSMFAAESDGGRRFDYMTENAFSVAHEVSAARYFSWYPDAGSPEPDENRGEQQLDVTGHYDLYVAGRTVRYLSPPELVREVVRFLMADVHLAAADINGHAQLRLLREFATATHTALPLPGDPWLLRDRGGQWWVLDKHRDWSDYLSLLYRLENAVPFGTIHWRETAMLEKRIVIDALQLHPQGAMRARRYVAPYVDAPAPLPDSYRVAELSLFAGVCPRTQEQADALRQFGINCIIDLRARDESGGSDIIWGESPPERHRYPLTPGAVPSREDVMTIHMVITDSLDRGKFVYLHDKGGLGRSTTVLGCLLVEWGLTPHEALEQIRLLASRMPKAVGRPIPETDAQKQFVLSWRRSARM